MFLRATLAAAVLLTGAPALAGSDAGTQSLSRAERNATTRCMMRQLHIPAGRGVGAVDANCTQVARAEVAASNRQPALASRETRSSDGRD